MALKGIKVIEMMGLAPGPVCGAILSDFGANVIVVQKVESTPYDVMSNGKKIISVNLKKKEGVDIVRKLCSTSDVLLDTYRPGVMEKLGLGPATLCKDNSRLIYARLSGYGQTGCDKDKAGHDINYVAMSGILSLLRVNKQSPTAPLNFAADFAGGSVLCSLGILMALFERTKSGKGQVVDCSMTEGIAYVGMWLYRSRNLPIWEGEPGSNLLDGGMSGYATYETKDGKYMAVGALEPQFYSNFLKGMQLSEEDYEQFGNQENNKNKFKEIFLTKTQKEWIQIFDKLDACVTPVLELHDIYNNKLHQSRNSFLEDNGILIPQPAPKLSRTPGLSVGKQPCPKPGMHTQEILQELGYNKEIINKLDEKGCIYVNKTPKL